MQNSKQLLLDAITKQYDNIYNFCQVHDFAYPVIFNLIKGQDGFTLRNGDARPIVLTVAGILDVEVEQLVPTETNTDEVVAWQELKSNLPPHDAESQSIRVPSPEHFLLQREKVSHLLKYLTDQEQYVLEQHFVGGVYMSEIGTELGVSRERVRQLRDECLDRLRQLTNKHKRKQNQSLRRRRNLDNLKLGS